MDGYVEKNTIGIVYGDDRITFDTVLLIADKLPTSDTDLPVGAIWRDGNDLKIKI